MNEGEKRPRDGFEIKVTSCFSYLDLQNTNLNSQSLANI